ncbi:universal stress protein [Actinomycetospora sp. C-140]
MGHEEEPLVVVGVDGTAHGAVALREALLEAARRGARVLAVSAWDRRELTPDDFSGGHVHAPDDRRVREQRTREWVDEVRAGVPDLAAVPVDVEVIPGHAGEVLVERAHQADLLVVGHRGRAGLASVALGSVGLTCLLHAPCPVLVVPAIGAALRPPPEAAATAR